MYKPITKVQILRDANLGSLLKNLCVGLPHCFPFTKKLQLHIYGCFKWSQCCSLIWSEHPVNLYMGEYGLNIKTETNMLQAKICACLSTKSVTHMHDHYGQKKQHILCLQQISNMSSNFLGFEGAHTQSALSSLVRIFCNWSYILLRWHRSQSRTNVTYEDFTQVLLCFDGWRPPAPFYKGEELVFCYLF
jgi:hypothetical protein